MATRLLPLLLAAAAVVAGCVVSPQPSPPDAVLVGDHLGLGPAVEDASSFVSVVPFTASAGAVDPAEGVVVVTNLDTTDPPSLAAVQPDGSFAIAVPGHPGQHFRFQAKDGDRRSQPFDVLVGASGEGLAALADTPACLVVDPARWAVFGAVDAFATITIRNTCSSPVAIGAPRLRRSLAGFTFTPVGPLDLGAGALATLTVDAGLAAEVEDVLFLDVTAPTAARRAITLTRPDP